MEQKIFVLIFLFILLNITFSLNANEKLIKPNNNESTLSFSFSNDFNKIKNFESTNIDYTKKRRGMLALGGVGVGLMVSGFIMEVGGSVYYLYLLYSDLMSEGVLGIFYGIDASPTSWFDAKFIALAIACAGSLLFLGGLAMTVVGFALARYYKNKVNNNKVSLSTFTGYDNGIFETGFVLRL